MAIDLDGTLGDYHGHLTAFMNLYWGPRRIRFHTEPWDGTGEMEDYFGLTKAEYRQAKLAFRQGGWKRFMPIFEGAHDLVTNVGARADIWIATSRPWQRLDNIDPDTVEWLRRNDLHFDGLVYGDDKYEQLVKAIDPRRIVAVVDDLPEQCEKADALGLLTIQRWNEYNVQPRRWLTGADSLAHVEGIVHTLIDRWHDDH